MAKDNTNTTEGITVDSSSKLEAIKNLIFGENIAEYNSEFETLKQDILTKREELESYIDEVRKELMDSIDTLSTDVNIRITDLENSLQKKTDALDDKKVDKKALGQLLVALGEKIIAK